MKPVSHQYEDKLLEFAYGELPAHEASAIDAHVKTCARCTAALDEIRSVRSAMSALPQVSVSDNGLESLMAYAEQQAKRNAEAAAPVPFFARFRKWVAPLAGVTAVLLVGGVYLKAQEKVDLTPEHAALEVAQKKSEADYKAPAPVAAPAVADEAKPAEEAAKADQAEKIAAPEKTKDLAAFKHAEGGETLDGLFDTKAKRQKTPVQSPSKPSPKTAQVQRDDKERVVDNEMQLAGAKPADAPANDLDRGGKGGGGRRELDSAQGNYYDARTAGTGSPTAGGDANKNYGLNQDVAKADAIERRSASKRGSTGLDDSATDDSYRANNAPVSKSGKKKASKLEIDDSPGGGSIARAPTGSLSKDVAASDKADKKLEEKAPEAEKAEKKQTVAAKESPPPPAAAAPAQTEQQVWTPEQAARAQNQAPSQYGVSSSSAPQQQAAPPPPPPKQVASNSKSSSFRLGIQSGQNGSGDETLEGQAVGPPSVTGAEIANNRKARQSQLADLMSRARAADNAGDLKQEAQLCDELLRNDAEGDLRAEALYRMCNLLQRLEQEDQAQRYCSQLEQQFPSSKWAASLRSQERNRSAAPPKAASKKSPYQQDRTYESPAPAAEPKNSAPAESMHAY
ncbi:MAG: zf-HC2 domain-containing protein [Myxococcaceae bacterium]